MRRISANYIYPVNSTPLKNGIIEFSDDGEILNLIDTKGELKESRNLEFYNGVITPGFINTHCHLEISEHKGKITEGHLLPHFLEKVFELKQQKQSSNTFENIKLYDAIMKSNGIVAVADVCNTNKTIQTKKNSKIEYYNFVEALGLGNAKSIFKLNQALLHEFLDNDLNGSIVPHAPYSVSKQLFQLIAESVNYDQVISIHNQETFSENELFKNKSGELYNKLQSLGVDYSAWERTGKNSLESVIDLLPLKNNLLFIHNTYSTKEDLDIVNIKCKNAYWCLCPLSNLYIENKLPDLNIFNDLTDKVTLGTDSLASNHTLSILEEMKAIVHHFNKINFKQVLLWATLNGAKALRLDNNYGSIEIGKKPGLNLITNFDFKQMQMTPKSEVKVLS